MPQHIAIICCGMSVRHANQIFVHVSYVKEQNNILLLNSSSSDSLDQFHFCWQIAISESSTNLNDIGNIAQKTTLIS